MEGKVGDGGEKYIAEKLKNGNQGPFTESGKNDIPIKNIASSESKTPLKTPVKEGEDGNEVKFIGQTMSEVNGDAKIDMDSVKACFSGMSKEELLQYVNDPFWVRMRMFLFVFFWLTWIAMLVGAISIIIVAPKCEPPKWHKQGPIYDVDLNLFLNAPEGVASKLFNAFIDKMAYLSELNVKGVILSPIFKTDELRGNNEDVVDFKAIDETLGSLDDFRELIKEAKARDIHVLLSMVPNHSSNKHVWFNKSVAKEIPYDNYYIWAPSAGRGPDGSRLPPNNWLSVTGGSAWEWNSNRQEFYLHQFDKNQPDLNFRNPHVLREFNETINFWLNEGVSGFNMKKVQYLLEDKNLENEQISKGKEGVVHTDYNFYYHSKTYNLPENAAIITSWRGTVHKMDGILMISGEAPIPSNSNGTGVPVDVARNDRLSDLPRKFTVTDLYPRLQKLVQNADDWPAFQLIDSTTKDFDYFSEEDMDGLNIITLLLKGTPVLVSGQELGLRKNDYFPWTNSSNSLESQREAKESYFHTFKALLKARESKAAIYGSSKITTLNDTLIALTRIKAGNPGYLAVYNLAHENVTADFTFEYVPEELMVYTKSMNYGNKSINIKDKVKGVDFVMTPRSAVVFTFVPNIEETN